MSIQKNLITLCFATVFTLGLAACGSDAPVNGAPDVAGPDVAGPDARTVAELFATAQESRDASAAAAKAAEGCRQSRDGGLGEAYDPNGQGRFDDSNGERPSCS